MDINEIDKQLKEEKGAYTVKTQEGEYTLYALPASIGYHVAQEIVTLVLPSVGVGADGFANGDDPFGNSQTFADVAMFLVKQLGDVDTLKIIKVLLKDAEFNGEVVNFDQHFMRNYGELFELVESAIKENFSSFFTHTGLRKKLADCLTFLVSQTEQEESQEESNDS